MKEKSLNHTVFSKYTEEACYWAGFLAADGCIDVNGTIGLELAAKDKEHIYLFKKYCLAEHDVSINSIKNSYRIRFVSNKIKEDLLYNYSINTDKTFNLVYPLLPDTSYYASFNRGFFDGDGCFSEFFNNRPTASYRVFLTSGSLVFLQDMLEHLKSIGITNGGSIQKKAANCWHIQLGIKDAASYLNWIYSVPGTRLDRKYLKYLDIIVNGNRKRNG